jgi:protein CMS1
MAPATTTPTKKQESASADAFEDDFVEEEVYSDTNDVDDEATTPQRKRSNDEDDKDDDKETPSTPAKKKKKNNKKKSRDPYHGLKIWTESPTVQAEYLGDRLKQALPALTSLEVTPMTSAALVDNAKFKQEHTMDALPNYIKFAVMRHKKLTKKPVGFGAPLVIVATHSAIRAADLSR